MTVTDDRLAVASLCELFQRSAAESPDAVALRTAGGGVEITWAEYRERVAKLAAALAKMGVKRGDTVALMLTNRPEFNLLDAAALHVGAAPFSIYNTLAPDQIAHVLENAGARVVFCERQFQPQLCEAAAGEPIEIVCIDDSPLEELEADDDFDFEASWRGGRPRRPRDVDLHVRDDRSSQGRRDHAPQRARRPALRQRDCAGAARRPPDLVPALRAHRRPLLLALRGAGVRLLDHLRRRSSRRRECAARGASDLVRRRSRGSGRSSRPRSRPRSPPNPMSSARPRCSGRSTSGCARSAPIRPRCAARAMAPMRRCRPSTPRPRSSC